MISSRNKIQFQKYENMECWFFRLRKGERERRREAPPPPNLPRRSDPSMEQHTRPPSLPHSALQARPPQISRGSGMAPTPAEGEPSRRLSPLTMRTTLPPPPPFHSQHGGPSRALHPPPPPPTPLNLYQCSGPGVLAVPQEGSSPTPRKLLVWSR